MDSTTGNHAHHVHLAVLHVGVSHKAKPQVTEEALVEFKIWLKNHPNATERSATLAANRCVHSALFRYQARIRVQIEEVEKEIAIEEVRNSIEFEHAPSEVTREILFALAITLVEIIIAPYEVTLDDLEQGIVERKGRTSIRQSRVTSAVMRRLDHEGRPIAKEAARKRVANALRAVRSDRLLDGLI